MGLRRRESERLAEDSQGRMSEPGLQPGSVGGQGHGFIHRVLPPLPKESTTEATAQGLP